MIASKNKNLLNNLLVTLKAIFSAKVFARINPKTTANTLLAPPITDVLPDEYIFVLLDVFISFAATGLTS